MKLLVLSIAGKMPDWVETGVHEFSKRLPRELSLEFKTLPLAKRSKNTDIQKVKRDESQQLLAAIPKGSHVVALEVKGQAWRTETLAQHLSDWQMAGGDVCFLIGGPDGLHQDCLNAAKQQWSLSALTLPHALVRVVLAEQLYRAWSINHNHPYHR